MDDAVKAVVVEPITITGAASDDDIRDETPAESKMSMIILSWKTRK